MKSTDELRKEFNTLRNNGTLMAMLGRECINCGCTEGIEYHHVVPIALGGTNKIRNIVPLCNVCHKAVTHSGHIAKYKGTISGGRKSNIPDHKAFKILDKWADGQIGNRKCCEMLKIKQSNSKNNGAGGPIQSRQYKKWCKIRGYAKVKNILDEQAVNSCSWGSQCDRIVGWIIRLDGSQNPIFFNDTGLNDDVMYKRRGTGDISSFRLIKSGQSIKIGDNFMSFRFEENGQLSFA